MADLGRRKLVLLFFSSDLFLIFSAKEDIGVDRYLTSKQVAIWAFLISPEAPFELLFALWNGGISLLFITLVSSSYTRAKKHQQIEIQLNYMPRLCSVVPCASLLVSRVIRMNPSLF